MTDVEPTDTQALSLRQASQIAIIGLLVLALLVLAYVARPVVVPLVAALVLFLVLRPAARALAAVGLPRALAAALILALIVGGTVAGFAQLREPATAWIERAPQIAFELRYKLEVLREPVEQATEAGKRVQEIAGLDDDDGGSPEVVVEGTGLLRQAGDSVDDVVVGLLLTVALLYFLLAAGETFIGRLVGAAPNFRAKQRAVRLITQIENDVSGYLAMTAAINVGLGVVVGLAFKLCGLPNAALWGVMVAGLNFIPYLGSLVGVAIVAVVSLISFDSLGAALLPPLVYAGCSVLEGQFLTPYLLGHRLAMNPLFVFLTVVVWFWMWGIPGALLAVPLLVCLRALCANIEPLVGIATVIGSASPRRRRNPTDAGGVVMASDPTDREDGAMNWQQVKGNWHQLKGRMQQRWGQLTDDDLDRIDGSRERAIGRLQESYGIAREQAEKDLDDWYRSL